MTFIFGLGNPGDKYQATRHNVGFMVVEALAVKLGVDWQDNKKLKAEVAKQGQLVLAKPQTFMNESGQAARAVIGYYQAGLLPVTEPQDLEQVLVVHDDLDLELGSYKIQWATGPKVHHGLASVEQHLGSDQFWHVRVGIDARQGDRSMPGSAYVLGKFDSIEKEKLDQTISQVVAELLTRIED